MTLTWAYAIISLALPGDFFRFMKNVGGGGGHELIVYNFKLEIRRIVKRVENSNIDQNCVNLVKTRAIVKDFRRYRTHLQRSRDSRRYDRKDTRRLSPKSGMKKWRKYLKSPNLQITNVVPK